MASAKVQVWNHKGNRRTTWRACEILGRMADCWSTTLIGPPEPRYNVRTLDGIEYRACARECVRMEK